MWGRQEEAPIDQRLFPIPKAPSPGKILLNQHPGNDGGSYHIVDWVAGQGLEGESQLTLPIRSDDELTGMHSGYEHELQRWALDLNSSFFAVSTLDQMSPNSHAPSNQK